MIDPVSQPRTFNFERSSIIDCPSSFGNRHPIVRSLAMMVAVCILWGGGLSGGGEARRVSAQTPAETANAAARSGGAAVGQTESIDAWINDLRSDSFAVRELASEKLFRLGHEVLDRLRQAKQDSHDAEQSERLTQIIATLADQDLESRIEKFLRGGDSELENWEEVEKWFGDSPRVRELFVDLYREHPVLVRALDGTPQELSLGMSLVRRRLIDRNSDRSQSPRRIDLIALLLAMNKPNFDAEAQYDLIVLSLLQLQSEYEFRTDPVFGEPFGRLVSQWMLDSDLSIRGQVLRHALDRKMEVALPLALKTLDENPDPELLCRCMQAIAKQGEEKHAARLAPYLDNDTTVFRPQYLGGHGGDVQVGDVAAAAIAYLFHTPVTEIGFARPAEHDILAIFYEELVIPADKDPEADDASDDEGKTESPPADAEPLEIMPPDGFENAPLQQRQTWERFQQMRKANLRRQAAREEIRDKARELLSKLPAEVSEKS